MRGKAHLRIALRRMARRDPSKRAECYAFIRNNDYLEALLDELEGTDGLAAPPSGSLMEWFQLLLDNYEEIFEIITKLLILFAGNEP